MITRSIFKKTTNRNLHKVASWKDMSQSSKFSLMGSLGGAGLGALTWLLRPKDEDQNKPLELLLSSLMGAAGGAAVGWGASKLPFLKEKPVTADTSSTTDQTQGGSTGSGGATAPGTKPKQDDKTPTVTGKPDDNGAKPQQGQQSQVAQNNGNTQDSGKEILPKITKAYDTDDPHYTQGAHSLNIVGTPSTFRVLDNVRDDPGTVMAINELKKVIPAGCVGEDATLLGLNERGDYVYLVRWHDPSGKVWQTRRALPSRSPRHDIADTAEAAAKMMRDALRVAKRYVPGTRSY